MSTPTAYPHCEVTSSPTATLTPPAPDSATTPTPRTSRQALGSFMLGLLFYAWFWVADLFSDVTVLGVQIPDAIWLVALITLCTSFILGQVALVQIHKSAGALRGRAYAVAGIVLCVLAPVIGAVIVALALSTMGSTP